MSVQTLPSKGPFCSSRYRLNMMRPDLSFGNRRRPFASCWAHLLGTEPPAPLGRLVALVHVPTVRLACLFVDRGHSPTERSRHVRRVEPTSSWRDRLICNLFLRHAPRRTVRQLQPEVPRT